MSHQHHPHHHRHHTIEEGSEGDAVYALQQALNAVGHPVAVDGIFGHGTHRAVVAFQNDNDLDADGIVGPNTWQALIDNMEG